MFRLPETLKKRLGSWGVAFLISLAAGICGAFIVAPILAKSNSLLTTTNSSDKGGQSVIDVAIRNGGDFDLCNLRANLKFEKPPSMSVEPPKWRSHASLSGTEFLLSSPKNIILKQEERIELRFVTEGSNKILNKNSMPEDICADCIREETIHASWDKASWLGIFGAKIVIVIGLLVLTWAVMVTSAYQSVIILLRAHSPRKEGLE